MAGQKKGDNSKVLSLVKHDWSKMRDNLSMIGQKKGDNSKDFVVSKAWLVQKGRSFNGSVVSKAWLVKKGR